MFGSTYNLTRIPFPRAAKDRYIFENRSIIFNTLQKQMGRIPPGNTLNKICEHSTLKHNLTDNHEALHRCARCTEDKLYQLRIQQDIKCRFQEEWKRKFVLLNIYAQHQFSI